jgi:hypothetical protein
VSVEERSLPGASNAPIQPNPGDFTWNPDKKGPKIHIENNGLTVGKKPGFWMP